MTFQPDEPDGLRNVAIAWVVVFLVSLVFFECTMQGAPLLDLEKLEITAEQLNPDNRDPYVPEYTGEWRNRAALDFRLGLLGAAYWDNHVHTETINTGVVRTVGWQWEAGLRITDQLSLFQAHHSRHVMDVEPDSSGKFPVENSYGLRIRIIETHEGRSIFH